MILWWGSSLTLTSFDGLVILSSATFKGSSLITFDAFASLPKLVAFSLCFKSL
jgi:hypothetical protein